MAKFTENYDSRLVGTSSGIFWEGEKIFDGFTPFQIDSYPWQGS
jgi:hypothetical protein